MSAPDVPPSVRAARALVASLVAHGVRDVVLAPGSRSAPLAYAVAAAADAGLLRLHVRVDERTAGFLALGLSRGADRVEHPGGVTLPRPVALVTTSGTAVANLHPAVLEAHHTGVPLVVLAADRPHELRGTGANQTTDQVSMFGPAVRLVADVPAPDGRDGEVRDLLATAGRAVAAALGVRTGSPGPVHLNLAFREPLVPPADLDPAASGLPEVYPAGWRRTTVVPAVTSAPDLPLPPARTVVVAGDGAGAVARELAEARGWPLLAEPSSGARSGPASVIAPSLVLAADEVAAGLEHVVVVGRATLTRPVQQLLARPDVAVTVVSPGGGPWPDAARTAGSVLPGVPATWLATHSSGGTDGTGVDRPWLERWRAASAAAARVVGQVLSDDAAPTGPSVARAVAAASTPHDVLVVGSSNPARDLDVVLGVDDPVGGVDARVRVVANRGLAGIDGTVSTAIGVALAGSGRRTRALVGDLTFLHDVGGLLRGPGEPSVDLQVVVVNDDGGSIFAGLEPGALGEGSAPGAATFERVFATPHGADLAHLCAGYGVEHRLVPDVASLREALASPSRGVQVLEVRVARDARRRDGAALAERVGHAVRETLGSR